MTKKTGRNLGRKSALALLVAFVLLGASTTPAADAPAHKIQVSDPAVAAELMARGARLLADYGSYQLLETDAVPQLLNRAATESRDEYNSILLNSGAIDATKPEAKALRKSVGAFAGKRLHLVQLVGPPLPAWHAALTASGVQIVSYIPHNAYLVYGDAKSLAALQTLAGAASYIQWDGAYLDDYKIHPALRAANAKGVRRAPAANTYAIQLVEDAADNAATVQLIDQHKLAPVRRQFKTLNYLNVIVELPAERVADLAAQPEVVSIQPYAPRRKFDERQDQIIAGNLSVSTPTGPGYLAWLASKGFTQAQFAASGFVVDVTDSGIDNGTTAPGHFGLYELGSPGQPSRVIYSRLEGTANSGSTRQGCDGHGNLNSHIIAGYNDRANGFPHTDAAGFHFGLGVCPFVKVGSSVIFDPANFTDPSYPNLQSRAYHDGARVSANSWGADTAGDYDVDAQSYDALVRDAQPAGSAFATAGNQEMVIVFAAGNAGPNGQTVGSPGTAKNIICVGAAENVHSHSTANGGNSAVGNDGCTTPDTEADSANDIASFSSRGPCSDLRKKPDLVAPGTHITGGVGQSSTSTNGTGAAISCFSGEGVCGLPGGGAVGSANNFFPLGQQFYSTSSGTSHSTPAVAGSAALVRQFFINNGLTPPSAAMTKGFLMNSARYLNGVSANDPLPSNSQGMGEVNLGTAFDGVARVVRDQLPQDMFTASGQARTISGTITDNTKPFRITLAWTDAPGNTTGNAYNNNLDLTVTIGGNTYKGNVFSGANSATGGSADARNNVESIFLPAGLAGNFTVTVTATSINSDGVPNVGAGLDQDFALVIYNAVVADGPAIVGTGFALEAESCLTTNGVVDPNEAVTLGFTLRNAGTVNATNLVATLLATGGVTLPGGPQNYGVLVTNGSAVTRSFSFTASGACGSNITATLALTDGATNLGQVAFTIPLGLLGPIFAQNFDGASAPALPVGWTTSAGGSESPWVTVSSTSDTAPNAAFSPAPGTTGSNELVSTAITLLPGAAQMTFRHRYQFETTYDGGVLEIKIGAGAFADILVAGGGFVSGGYVDSIDSGNALGARQAWTGTNSAFHTVVVALPASAGGQNVQFRWRAGTDFSVAGGGWWIDSVVVSGGLCCGAAFPPLITAQPQGQTVGQGGAAGFSVSAIGQNPLSLQWYLNAAPVSGATNSSYSVVSALTNDAGNYFVIVTNASGSATSSIASLAVIVAPLILTNPASLTVNTGSTAGFSVTVIGAAPLSYQWQFNGTNLAGANTNSYARLNAQLSDAGSYTVIVSNYAGSVTSGAAVLAVVSGSANGVVISQIYGGGGNSGATYQNDYVELFNASVASVNLTGWSVQYASASGTGWSVANLSGTMLPGRYYLLQLASGGTPGGALPTPDATSGINISAVNGKLALVTNQVALTGANPVGASVIMDFAGFGSANAFEGAGAAPAGDNSMAIFRKNGGATDTGNNAADFAAGTPNPRNSSVGGTPTLDLAVTLRHSGNFVQGDAADAYTIIVTNVGTLATTGTVSVVEVLPAGLTATALNGTGWAVNLGALTATRDDALSAGTAYPALTLTVGVASNAPSLVTNTVTVATGGDVNSANNTASDATTISPPGGGGVFTGVLAGWDMHGLTSYGPTPLSPSTNAPNLTVVGLTRGSGVATAGTSAARAWGGNGFDAASDTAAVTAGDFATFSITVQPGYKVSFSAVSRFDYRRSANGPTSGVWQYQVGAGAFVNFATNAYSSSSDSGVALPAISLAAIGALQDVGPGTNVTFRIVNYAATTVGGNWYLYDVLNTTAPDLALTGTVASLVVSGPPAAAPMLTLSSLTGGPFQFTISGTTGSNYVIDVSTNIPGNWTPAGTGAAPFLFARPATSAQQFYRARVAP